MYTTLKMLALATGLLLFISCNNQTTETDHQDTTDHEHTDTTAHNGANNNMQNMQSGLMATMKPMMDSMKMMNMTGDFDIDFANMMIHHHRGAIMMSEQELQSGKDEKLKQMAQRIITSQKEEITRLQDFVKTYKPSGMKHGEGELQKSMTDMHSKMQGMPMTGNMDKDFATMMMHHHQHAIDMAKMEQTHGMSDKMKKMAQKIIDDSNKDIAELKAWLDANK